MANPSVRYSADRQIWYNYCGDFIYADGRLERMLHEAGWMNPDGGHTAQICDWQGNVRATWTQGDVEIGSGTTGPTTLKRYDNLTAYYPYGLPFSDWQGTDRYLYSGKELERADGLQLYDFHARLYDPQLALFHIPDPLATQTPSTSPFLYCAANPIAHIDPTGKKVFAVHGTWSDPSTWKQQDNIYNFCHQRFGDTSSNFQFKWSGENNHKERIIAANDLVDKIKEDINAGSITGNEPITLVGHSHGGNVSILAINMMVEMDEFKDKQINLLTINTPVRDDYQLSKKAAAKVDHVNVYDSKDPVQALGGKTKVSIPFLGEKTIEGGKARRTFPNAQNIPVKHPQGAIIKQNNWFLPFIPNLTLDFSTFPRGNINDYYHLHFHDSHNRVQDWDWKAINR